jgi:hypothetical protein
LDCIALRNTNREQVCGGAALGIKCVKTTELEFIRKRVYDESYIDKIIVHIAGKN